MSDGSALLQPRDAAGARVRSGRSCDWTLAAVSALTLSALAFLVYLSHSPSPFLLPNVLHGEWAVETVQGKHTHDVIFDMSAELSEQGAHNVPFTASPLTILNYSIPPLRLEPVWLQGSGWRWEGQCNVLSHGGGAVTPCTLLLFRHRLLFSVFGTGESPTPSVFVLFRKVPLPPESFFERKFKFIVAIMILVIGAKFISTQLNPSTLLDRRVRARAAMRYGAK